MKKLSFPGILALLVLSSFALATTLECFDDGSIKIDGMKKKWPVYAQAKGSQGDPREVPGEYIHRQKDDDYVFYSDEAIFVSQKGAKYEVKYSKYKRTITCPPFYFSCRIFNISIDYCYHRNGTFLSKFMVYNFHFDPTNVLRFTQPYTLKYEATTTDNRNLIHASDSYSQGFEKVNITMRKLNAGNKYIFLWPTEQKIKKFAVRYDRCRQGRYNFYRSALCTEAVACTIDKDCLSDEHCQEGACQKLDCGECQYLENHACLNYSCCLNEDCQENEQCLNHTCTSFTCAEDEIIAGHACPKLECADDEYISNHTCLKLECAEEEQALNHTCQKISCRWFERPKEHRCLGWVNFWWERIIK